MRIDLTAADLMSAEDVVAARRQRYLDERHYDRVIAESAAVLKPHGGPLFFYAKDAVSPSVCANVFKAFTAIRIPTTDARGMAAGGQSFQRLRADGRLSNTRRYREMRSAVLGFYDATPRNPYRRPTAFTRSCPEALESVYPLAWEVDRVFRALAPKRWAAQRQYVDTIPPQFVIGQTVFTSVTVNLSERMAMHRDANDYRRGLGVMTVLEDGGYSGGELIFPKYRTAVDMRTGGVCLADVHEWHGNAPLVGTEFVRLSFIFYARERMHECASGV